MSKKIVSIIFVSVFFLVPTSAYAFILPQLIPPAASAIPSPIGLPFGGRVTSVIPCNGGLFFIPALVGLPYSGPLMWAPSSAARPYLVNMTAPPVPSQCILGIMGPPLVCTVGKTVIGGGPLILFYGSSAPGCVSASLVSPAEAAASQAVSDAAVSAAGAASVGALRFEGANKDITPEMRSRLEKFQSEYGTNYAITATTNGVHKSTCHKGKTCVDINFRDEQKDLWSTNTSIVNENAKTRERRVEEIDRVIKSAEVAGFRAVYEVADTKTRDELRAALVKRGYSQARAAEMVIRARISAPHFSLYCPRNSRGAYQC